MRVVEVLLGTVPSKKDIYKQQARGSDPMPKAQKPSKGPTQPHPLRGKLVGGA